MRNMENYDDIIRLAPPQTLTQMTMSERAAQFSAFAALSGFEDAISGVEQRLCAAYENELSCDIDFYD